MPKPLFNARHFRRRFRMVKHVFNRIREGVVEYDDYFKCKKDAFGNVVGDSVQKTVIFSTYDARTQDLCYADVSNGGNQCSYL